MKFTIDHLVESSVFLWLDNVLVEENTAFGNYTGTLQKSNSNIYAGMNAYVSPHRQWVYDSSISGVQVPTGVTAGSFIPRGANMHLNYNRGEALSTSSLSNVQAAYSYKEVNLYPHRETEEMVIFEKKFTQNPRTSPAPATYEETDHVYPCIFIKMSGGRNKTLDFCGMAATTIPVRLIFLADTPFLYRAVCSVLRDKKETFIPIFSASELPFDYFEDLKNGTPFDYTAKRSEIQQDPDRLSYIRDVSISDFSDRVNGLFAGKVLGGFIDLDIEILRFPHNT